MLFHVAGMLLHSSGQDFLWCQRPLDQSRTLTFWRENSFEYIVQPFPPCTVNTKRRLKNSTFSSALDMPSSRNGVFQVDFYGLNGDVLACGLSRGKTGGKICFTGKTA